MESDLNDWVEIVQIKEEESAENCASVEVESEESMNESNVESSCSSKTYRVIKLKPLQLCVIKIQNLLKVLKFLFLRTFSKA